MCQIGVGQAKRSSVDRFTLNGVYGSSIGAKYTQSEYRYHEPYKKWHVAETQCISHQKSGTGCWGYWGGIYGIIQKAADSAHRLHITYPTYYSALYAQELEMMYFLIEPLLERAGAFKAQWVSDGEIKDIITRMIR